MTSPDLIDRLAVEATKLGSTRAAKLMAEARAEILRLRRKINPLRPWAEIEAESERGARRAA